MGPARPGHSPGTGPGSCASPTLTQGQLEACVKEDAVEGGVLGATDLAVCHDDLGVQGQPLSRAVLDIGGGDDRGQDPG